MPGVPELGAPGPGAPPFVLRGWTLSEADIAAVVRAAQDPEIGRYSSVGAATTADQAET